MVVDTAFARLTLPTTGSTNTSTINTDLAGRALHFGAGVTTLAIGRVTELVGRTFDAGAQVANTLFVDADFIGVALGSSLIAIINNAASSTTDLTRLTTGITGLIDTNSALTDLTTTTLSCTASVTTTVFADTIGTGCAVVYAAITVVVTSITNLFGGLWCGTGAPITGDANLGASTTGTGTAFAEIFVHLTIAVVVFCVAIFCARFGSRAVGPLSANTGFLTLATGIGAGAIQAIIDTAVAIVVHVVTNFGRGLTCSAASSPFTTVADLSSRTTVAITVTLEVFVHQTITVIIEVVADLFGSGVGDGFHRVVQVVGVVGLVVFRRAAFGSTTSSCHTVEAIGINAGTEADDVRVDIERRTKSSHLTIGTGGLTVGDEHDGVFAVFDTIDVADLLDVSLRHRNRCDQVGTTTGATVSEVSLEIGDTGGSITHTGVDPVDDRSRAVEQLKTEEKFATIVVGDSLCCADCVIPFVSAAHRPGVVNDNV